MNPRPLLFVLGGALASTALGAPASPPASEPQDTMTRIAFPNATVNGHPARLLLDTGSSSAMLFASGANRLGVKIEQFAKPFNQLRDKSVLTLSVPTQVTTDGGTITAQFPVLDLSRIGNAPYDGLIGWPEVRDNILVFDPAKNTVSSVPTLPPETASWLKLKIKPAPLLILEMSLPDGKLGDVLVDTGSESGVVLPPEKWQEWKKAHPHASISAAVTLMPGAGGARTEETWVDEIQLGALTLTHVWLGAASSGASAVSKNFAGSLGMNALARLDLVVDGKNGFAYLRPRSASVKMEYVSQKPPPVGVKKDPAAETVEEQIWTVTTSVQLKTDRLFTISGGTKSYNGDFAGAIADLNHALEINPKNMDAYTYRGITKANHGDYDGAISDLTHALDLDPKNADALAIRDKAYSARANAAKK